MTTALAVLPVSSGAAMLTTPADTAFLTAAIKKEVTINCIVKRFITFPHVKLRTLTNRLDAFCLIPAQLGIYKPPIRVCVTERNSAPTFVKHFTMQSIIATKIRQPPAWCNGLGARSRFTWIGLPQRLGGVMRRSSRADMPNQRPGVRIHTLHP